MIERWKTIPRFSRYEISTLGRVRGKVRGKVLLQRISRIGYHEIFIYGDRGERKNLSVHRLVCAAFNGIPISGKTDVNHIDANKSNNRNDNLEWCSHLENIRHAWRMGLRDHTLGEGSKVAVLSNKKVHTIRKMKASGHSYRAIASYLGVGATTVRWAYIGRTWAHVK